MLSEREGGEEGGGGQDKKRRQGREPVGGEERGMDRFLRGGRHIGGWGNGRGEVRADIVFLRLLLPSWPSSRLIPLHPMVLCVSCFACRSAFLLIVSSLIIPIFITISCPKRFVFFLPLCSPPPLALSGKHGLN